MMWLTHLLSSIVLGLLATNSGIAQALVIVGGLAPDLDSRLPSLHRRLFHNLFFILFLAVVNPWLATGALLHLLLDSLTVTGVCLFWPLKKKMYGFKICRNRGLLDWFLLLASLLYIIIYFSSPPATYTDISATPKVTVDLVYAGQVKIKYGSQTITYAQCRLVLLVYENGAHTVINRTIHVSVKAPKWIILHAYYTLCKPCWTYDSFLAVYQLGGNGYTRIKLIRVGAKASPEIKIEGDKIVLYFTYTWSSKRDTLVLGTLTSTTTSTSPTSTDTPQVIDLSWWPVAMASILLLAVVIDLIRRKAS